MLKEYIQQFCVELEIDDAPLKELQDVYPLSLDENTLVNVAQADPGFTLSAPIGELPDTPCEEFLSDVMAANLFGHGTGGALIGSDPEGKILSLAHAVSYDLNYDDFFQEVENFVNILDFWQQELQRQVHNDE